MFVTDRHSLTRNFEMFALCSSQTAKQIDGFSALGAGKKQRNKEPAAGAALHDLVRVQVIFVHRNAAGIGYKLRPADLDSPESRSRARSHLEQKSDLPPSFSRQSSAIGSASWS